MKSSPQKHPVSEKQAKELLQAYRPMIVVDTNFRDSLRADLLRNAQKKWWWNTGWWSWWWFSRAWFSGFSVAVFLGILGGGMLHIWNNSLPMDGALQHDMRRAASSPHLEDASERMMPVLLNHTDALYDASDEMLSQSLWTWVQYIYTGVLVDQNSLPVYRYRPSKDSVKIDEHEVYFLDGEKMYVQGLKQESLETISLPYLSQEALEESLTQPRHNNLSWSGTQIRYLHHPRAVYAYVAGIDERTQEFVEYYVPAWEFSQDLMLVPLDAPLIIPRVELPFL